MPRFDYSVGMNVNKRRTAHVAEGPNPQTYMESFSDPTGYERREPYLSLICRKIERLGCGNVAETAETGVEAHVQGNRFADRYSLPGRDSESGGTATYR